MLGAAWQTIAIRINVAKSKIAPSLSTAETAEGQGATTRVSDSGPLKEKMSQKRDPEAIGTFWSSLQCAFSHDVDSISQRWLGRITVRLLPPWPDHWHSPFVFRTQGPLVLYTKT